MIKRILFFILPWFFLYSSYAQRPGHSDFIHFGVNEGLSQNTVFDIAQDKQGHMWFATYDGLNKYDGYDFTIYRHDELNPYSIGSDVIRTCIVDTQGRIWAGTEKGLSLYDMTQDKFYNFTYSKDNRDLSIHNIIEINEKQLLLFSNKSTDLLLFDTETHQFSEQPLHPSLSQIQPTTIYRQGDYIYIGSYTGIYIYSISQNTVKNFLSTLLKGKMVYSILQQSPTCLWIGTEGDGLYKLDIETQKTTHYANIPGKQGCISSNYIRSLTLDFQSTLWIGTINALNIYNEDTDSFSSYTSEPEISGSLSHTSVLDIFTDSQGGMWLGTYFGGVNYYHPLKNRFHNTQFSTKKNSLNCNTIGCIKEDAQKGIWIGTNNGGVNYYNPQTHIFNYYTKKEGLASNDIKAIYIDKVKDLIYIGTHTGGLGILNPKSGHIENIYHGNELKNIYDIQPTEDGELWLTGMRQLIRFNPKDKTFSIARQTNGQPLVNDQFTYLKRDSKRRLWLAGEKGVSVYIEQSNGLLNSHLLPEDSFSSKAVNCIYEAHDGIFWIGTRSGVWRFDESKKELKQYTVNHGLPNNTIHGILEDSTGRLWLSTNKGLSCFQPKTEKFRNYTNEDGLQSNQFTSNAYCQTSDGQMHFGGVNGITSFYPEQIVDNPYTPPVVITKLSVFNKTIYPNDNTGILEKAISDTRSITLTAGQSMFSLDFVVSNYISGSHNTFAYMLKGYDKEWYQSRTYRTVSYSNLPAGTYTFLVKAANSDGKWNEQPTELEITILPVWYKTWWAFLIFISAFIATTIFIFRYFWIRKSMEAELQMERMDKEKQKEVNEMKLRFFINISHEIRTPLTLIIAPVQEMINKVNDKWLHKQLEQVQKNTNRLLHLVNQLMDYRRAELGVFNLKVQYTPIHEIIEKDFLFYENLARRKKIAYDFSSDVEGKSILCDPNYLELIVNNLLSNAFKYTNEGQSITVTLKQVGEELLLQVKDTGNGIPIDKQGKIFERFYQIDNEHLGSGIGLALVQRLVDLHHGRIELESQEGMGSTFSIYLPTAESAYSPEEKVSDVEVINEPQTHTTNNQEMYTIDTVNEDEEENMMENNSHQKETILIVEDNPDIRQYLSDELGYSFHIQKAENGEEALDIIKRQEIDLILTDVMMPIMDGLQLCRQIKQNLSTCHIPIIILSAKADLKEQLKGLQVGADDYIPKPFSITIIKAKIKNLFRTRYRAIEHYSKSLDIEPSKVALNNLDEELLKKAIEIVEKNMGNAMFSTNDFAREMCMSRSNLHLKMKALTGESTNDFIRKIRFNHACKLLKEGRLSVTEISTIVGFNTPSYFSTSFKKYFGCLPSEYGK